MSGGRRTDISNQTGTAGEDGGAAGERERRETGILPAWAHGGCSREGVRIFVDNERRMRRGREARGKRKGRGEEGWWEKEWDVSKDLSLCGCDGHARGEIPAFQETS